jgi:hypothetical protein
MAAEKKAKKEKKDDLSKQMETIVLENSLRKICNLLVRY